MTVDTVVSMFAHAKRRLTEALAYADDRNATFKRYHCLIDQNDASFGKLTKGQRWWLMNRVLGLTVPEIAEIEGTKPDRAKRAIRRTADRIITGLTILTNPTNDEVTAAQARIERDRADVNKAKARRHRNIQKAA